MKDINHGWNAADCGYPADVDFYRVGPSPSQHSVAGREWPSAGLQAAQFGLLPLRWGLVEGEFIFFHQQILIEHPLWNRRWPECLPRSWETMRCSGPFTVCQDPDKCLVTPTAPCPLRPPARRGWGTKTTLSDPQEYIRVPCPGELTHQPCLSLPLHTGALRQGQSLPGSRDGILVPSPQRPEAAAMEHEQWGAMSQFQTSL